MDSKTSAKQAYDEIKDLILNCVFQPGELIFEKDLMERLDFGRTPIREAIHKLSGENLLIIIPKKGVQIAPLSVVTLQEIHQIRKVLEPYSLREAVSRLTEEDDPILENLKRLHKEDLEIGTNNIAVYGGQLHLFIAQKTGNKTLYDILSLLRESNYRGQTYYYGYMIENLAPEKKLKLQQLIGNNHIELIDAMINRDADRAVECLLKDIMTMSNAIAGTIILD